MPKWPVAPVATTQGERSDPATVHHRSPLPDLTSLDSASNPPTASLRPTFSPRDCSNDRRRLPTSAAPCKVAIPGGVRCGTLAKPRDWRYTESMPQHVAPAITLPPDPVIEAYKKDIDRTLLRETLKLTPAQRLERLQNFVQTMATLRAAARRKA